MSSFVHKLQERLSTVITI